MSEAAPKAPVAPHPTLIIAPSNLSYAPPLPPTNGPSLQPIPESAVKNLNAMLASAEGNGSSSAADGTRGEDSSDDDDDDSEEEADSLGISRLFKGAQSGKGKGKEPQPPPSPPPEASASTSGSNRHKIHPYYVLAGFAPGQHKAGRGKDHQTIREDLDGGIRAGAQLDDKVYHMALDLQSVINTLPAMEAQLEELTATRLEPPTIDNVAIAELVRSRDDSAIESLIRNNNQNTQHLIDSAAAVQL
ncbi:hypothetical protein C8R46DRAFT_1355856 [Mycena filopes]|nr:hypothetical protein C8R46DRAFT_1355856 [Mycena filopes]